MQIMLMCVLDFLEIVDLTNRKLLNVPRSTSTSLFKENGNYRGNYVLAIVF